MQLKKILTLVAAVILLISTVTVIASAADLPISVGTPENVTVTQNGTTLTVSYEVGESDKSLLKMASNSLILSLAGVEKLEVGAQVDYKVNNVTDWLAEDQLISGPCKLNESLSVSVSNPALALIDWNTTTLCVRVRWAGSVKMKGEDATFITGDWSDVVYYGMNPVITPDPTKTEPSATETQPSATETQPSATEAEPTATEAEPTATEAEPTATEAEPTATGAVLYGDANEDGNVNMKDVLLLRKYLVGMQVSFNAVNSDVTFDGNVNMKDVLLLRKYLVGLVPTPVG